MIIRKDGGIERNSMFPNSDWYEEGNIVIDETTGQGKMFAEKIIAEYPDVEIVSENGVVTDVISVPNTARIFNGKLETIRNQRDALLRECDFTQLPDAPLTQEQKDAYAVYRQALRDLPETITPENIDTIEFPTKPI